MKKILFGLVVVLFFVKATFACTIAVDPKAPRPTPKSEFDDATVVFWGEFQSARIVKLFGDFSGVEATFKMTTVFKGFYRSEGELVKIRTGMGGGDCGISGLLSENKGAQWIVYSHLVTAFGTAGEIWLFTGIVEPTSRLKDMPKAHLDFLKTIASKK